MRMATRNSRVGAMPDRNDEAVNSSVQMRKKRLRPRSPDSQPVAGMITALAARYEVNTQATSSTLAESEPCMCGSATLVTLVSTICITVTSMTANVMAHLRALDNSPVADVVINAGGW